MIPEKIPKMYYSVSELAEMKGLKPTKVKYILEVLKIPYRKNRSGTIRVHINEAKRYFFK